MVEVVSETGKGRARLCQVRIEETSASEPLMNCRKRNEDVETKGKSLPWDKSERHLFTAQAASGGQGGVTSVQASVRNVGTCIAMLREQLKWQPHKRQSTKARCRGGAVCSSDEGAVMALERRHGTVRLDRKNNRKWEDSFGSSKAV